MNILSINNNYLVFQLLMYITPILLAVLSFIGALAVKQFIDMNKSINEIKVIIQKLSSEHESLETRVEHLENKVLK